MANDLTGVSGAAFGVGKFGQALTAGFGTVPSGSSGGFPTGTTWSVSFWFKATAAPSQIGVIVSFSASGQNAVYSGWIGMDNAGHFGVAVPTLSGGTPTGNDTKLYGSTSYADGTWHYATVRSDGSTVTVHVDGVQQISQAATWPINAGTTVCVGSYDTSGNYAFGGAIDELAFFSAVLGSVTPPGAAYTGSEANLLSLYHFDGSTADSKVTPVPTTTVAVDAAAWNFSPANWRGDTGRGGSAYRQSWNNGATATVAWTAAASGAVATLVLNSTGGSNKLVIFLNGVLNDEVAGNASVDLTALSGFAPGASNTARIVLKRSDQSARWNGGTNCVQIQGLRIDTGSSAGIAPAARPWVKFDSDSIGEGINANAGVDSAVAAYTFLLGQALDALGYDFCNSACGGNGWLQTGDSTGDVPAYYFVSAGNYDDTRSRWNKIDQGVSLLDGNGHVSAYGATNTEPVAIITNLMTNEAVHALSLADAQESVRQSIVARRAAAPNALLVHIVPFTLPNTGNYYTAAVGAQYIAALKAGVAAYQSAHPADSKVVLWDLGTAVSNVLTAGAYVYSDKVHPLAAGHAMLAPAVAGKLAKALAGPSGPAWTLF